MTTSDQVNELAGALAKAQGAIGGAAKSSANPFYKSKYADLASVWDACRQPLADNGLAVVQSPSADGARVSVDTLLIHASGQWLRGTVSATAKEDAPQAIGSTITYLRRYALQSIAGVAPEDDDGEVAQGRTTKTPEPLSKPAGYDDWLTDMQAAADHGTEALRAAWKASRPEYRDVVTKDAATYHALKARAATAA